MSMAISGDGRRPVAGEPVSCWSISQITLFVAGLLAMVGSGVMYHYGINAIAVYGVGGAGGVLAVGDNCS